MLTIMKVFIILFLLCLLEQVTPPWQLPKQISKLFFQMSVQVYSLFGQTEGDRKIFFWSVQERVPHREITPESIWLL